MSRRNNAGDQEPQEKKKLDRKNLVKLLSLFSFIRPYRKYFIAGLVFLILSSFSTMAFPVLAGKLFDIATGKPDSIFKSIDQVALALGAILLVQSGFSYSRVYFFAQFSERAMANIRATIHHKLMQLPVPFFDTRRVGELISRITSDVSLLQDTFSISLGELVRQVINLVLGLIIILVLAPKLTLFMLSVFPVLVIGAMIFGRFIRRISKSTQDELAQANVVVEETLQSVQMVKAYTNEAYENNRYKSRLENVVNFALKAARYRGAFISFIIFALFGGIVAVMWYGATLVQQDIMSTGELLSFVFLTVFIGGSIGGLGDLYGQLQRAIGASERVLEILNAEGEPTEGVQSETGSLTGQIAFVGVKFRYPTRPEELVIKDLSFTINPGEKVALVGPSGAGKSTILQLLLRYYTPEEGQISIDGIPASDYNLKHYRQKIGIVPQEVILFGGSIRENIAYGKPGASEEEILLAAEKANALEFINTFKDGLDTLVGERGIKLSGGQRQRIAIARAILKDPAILVLDEATSALDTASENLVQEALEELMKGRTTIMIAHRLSTVRNADRILVIQEGAIIESGTHEELSALEDGTYRNLLRLQFQLV